MDPLPAPNPKTKRPGRRVSQRDIAAAAGVSQVTVSLALRGHPSLPEETRERLRTLAKEMGYVPDPALEALVSYRNAKRPAAYHSTIGWINTHDTEQGWKTAATTLYHDAAVERATELGLKLETFWLRGPGMSPARMSSILRARNIVGLLMPPQPKAFADLSLDWGRFVVVTLGFTLSSPIFHCVASNHFLSMRLLMQQLVARGYRRPGLAIVQQMDDRVARGWTGGFLAESSRMPPECRVPLHLQDGLPLDPAQFDQWFLEHEPDAVVTLHREIIPALQKLGRRVPEDVGVAFPTVVHQLGEFSGIDEDSRRIGRTAVDILSGLLRQNEVGVPAHPMRVLVEGQWAPGYTTRG
ncbi:MAG: LacI family DNA-binding transcriptional regulator [Verrucomicrobiota bacterium JB022]|nr:LacI family DNA-binding transcriptional regulator [Verrucomicrobiota bacterium JB022]